VLIAGGAPRPFIGAGGNAGEGWPRVNHRR
jgi:hypothetical protein